MRYLLLVTLAFTLIAINGCKKDETTLRKPPVATILDPGNIQLPTDSVLLSGSGTTKDGTIVGYLWSQVSGPSLATIVSPSSPATKIRDMKSGNYIFQFAVIDNFGLTGVDTVSVTVLPSPVITKTFQPTNNSDEVHLLGLDDGVDVSGNATTEIGVAAWTKDGVPFKMRAAFKFNLSEIPANATIISARLTLYSNHTPLNGDHTNANAGSDNSMYLQRIATDWSGSGANWTNQPQTTTSGQISLPHTTLPFLDLTDIDVTSMVGFMVAPGNNNGFFLRLQNEFIYTSRIFCSSKYPDASRHPKLVVTYQVN